MIVSSPDDVPGNKTGADKNSSNRWVCFLLLVLSVAFVGCGCEPAQRFVYHPPEQNDDGLVVGSLEDVTIDPEPLNKAIDDIHCGKYGEIHSLLLFKDGRLVFEEYFPGHRYQWDGANHHGEWTNWDKSMMHDVKSVSKSVVAMCVGIAIDQGFIESADQSVFEYLPDHQRSRTAAKEKITIEHLLTMTSGLQWNEWQVLLSSAANDIIGISFQDLDPITYILEKPLVHEPGTTFTYSGGNTLILGEIIKNASGMGLDRFAQTFLFDPLGIDASDWGYPYKEVVIDAGGGLEIKPRDMLKIGVTTLNGGVFNGRQILSEQWIAKCTTPYANNTEIDIPGHASGEHGYAYSWWLKSYRLSGRDIDMYNAVGWGGQQIVVIPELNAVVTFTGGNYASNVKVFGLVEKYILPAIDSGN